jgi:hypothetical protein
MEETQEDDTFQSFKADNWQCVFQGPGGNADEQFRQLISPKSLTVLFPRGGHRFQLHA